MEKFDFGGWATKHNIRCTDGLIIMPDAFVHNDGKKVPLIWNHVHNDPRDVLGHAILEHRDEGVYAHCSFNDTEDGQRAKKFVEHGDITALSIHAGRVKKSGSTVTHGDIREVSLVMAGANPGASIQSVMIKHGDDYVESEDEVDIYNDDEVFELSHSIEASKKDNDDDNDDETLEDVYNTLTPKQKNLFVAIVAQALAGDDSGKKDNDKKTDDKGLSHEDKDDPEPDDVEHKDENKEDDIMHKNVFDNTDNKENDGVLSHSDMAGIVSRAKNKGVGTLQNAIEEFIENNDSFSHGIEDIESLFPEYKDVNPGAPELITRDMGWVSTFMQKVHKSPISRIRTRHADARGEDLTALGYEKGKKKKNNGALKLLKRTTDPQTIYCKDYLDRDDIIDIIDFDVVDYQYGIMRQNLEEKVAIAALIGDGLEEGDEGKISETHIRPIWLDAPLYTIHTDVDIDAARKELQGTGTDVSFGENYIYAEAIITSALYAREKYRGSGNLDFYCTPHLLNVMLLARDMNGRRIYDSKTDLAAALNVNEIHTVEQFEGKTRTTEDGDKKQLLGLFVNLKDYQLGSTKGGEITKFSQFDIDFNQEKYLIETRLSGALVRPYSAIALEIDPNKKSTSPSDGIVDGGSYDEVKG